MSFFGLSLVIITCTVSLCMLICVFALCKLPKTTTKKKTKFALHENDKKNSDDVNNLKENIKKNNIKTLHYHYDDLSGSDSSDSKFKNLENFVLMISENFKPSEISVVLQITSCGGLAYKFERAYSLLVRLKEKGFGITGLIDTMCLSGGYMLACACDKIYSSRFAKVGSVGVIASVLNYSSLLDKIGISSRTFKTGKYKNSYPVYDHPRQEDNEKMDELMSESFDIFKEIVKTSRKMTDEQMETVFTAKIMHGNSAVESGLVDKIVDVPDFMASTKNMLLVTPTVETKSSMSNIVSLLTSFFSLD